MSYTSLDEQSEFEGDLGIYTYLTKCKISEGRRGGFSTFWSFYSLIDPSLFRRSLFDIDFFLRPRRQCSFAVFPLLFKMRGSLACLQKFTPWVRELRFVLCSLYAAASPVLDATCLLETRAAPHTFTRFVWTKCSCFQWVAQVSLKC